MHQDDAPVQESSCRAFSKILEVQPDLAALVGERDGQLSLHSSVLAAMLIHVNDSYVFQAACSAMHAMANCSKDLQQYLVAKGTYLTIVKRMRKLPEDADTQV